MKSKKVLSHGPKKVGNKGEKSMGTTIGQGKTMKPKGSDRSKVGAFNGRKYEMTRRAVFGMK